MKMPDHITDEIVDNDPQDAADAPAEDFEERAEQLEEVAAAQVWFLLQKFHSFRDFSLNKHTTFDGCSWWTARAATKTAKWEITDAGTALEALRELNRIACR